MSDYGDDYSDYGEDWFYVEDEYMMADDLAEHAIQSPPPTTYGDEDAQAEWDRFDYFNDLEYASDGYDDATFEAHDSKAAKTGQKRKRGVQANRGRKKQKSIRTQTASTRAEESTNFGHSPVVWRSQADRELKPKLLDDKAESFALLKDWREKLKDTPQWARGSPGTASPEPQASKLDITEAPLTSKTIVSASEMGMEDDFEGEEAAETEEGNEEMDIDPAALMAVLQSRLADAGGPLSGMDPQQLLQFALRMATDKDAGDDIAGEMADAMLGQDGEEEEEDAEAEANLLSWVARQRTANQTPSTQAPSDPHSSNSDQGSKIASTPSSSIETKDSSRVESSRVTPSKPKANKASTKIETNDSLTSHEAAPSRKRKADDDEAGISKDVSKRQATRSYNAPTAASQARAVAAGASRSRHAKRT